MYVRPMHHHWELGRWLGIVALATLLCLLLARALGAAEIADRRPALLPTEIHDWAQPMGESSSATLAAEPPLAELGRAEPQLAEPIWRLLELHRRRRHAEAIRGWNELTIPTEMEVWKQIALGQALLASDQFDDAEQALERALELRPKYAIASYFRGVLRLQQSYLAEEWPDYVPGRRTRLVTVTRPLVPPRTRSFYELAATQAFEQALESRSGVQWDEPLVPHEFAGMSVLEPTVRDLLAALGADLWEGKAHNALSYLYLERGALEVSENHMDRAVEEGLAVVYGYRDLGNEYQARGQHADAARAYLKAARFHSDKMGTTWDALRSLRDALLGQ